MEEVDSILVSIIVLTYNSSKYVLDTLESIKRQQYRNLELIITDDASKDDTLALCQEWMKDNKSLFNRVELLSVLQSTGIPANCNRGIRVAQGEWIKLIAGDDALLPNCIYDNLSYILHNPNCYILQTNELFYKGELNENKRLSMKDYRIKRFLCCNCVELQHKLLLYSNPVFAPTLFIKKKVYEEIGYYDEDIKMMEDLPFSLKVTQHGYRIYYNPVNTVAYRLHEESVMSSNNINTKLYNYQFYHSHYLMYKRYRKPYYSIVGKIVSYFYYKTLYLLDRYNCNSKSSFMRYLFMSVESLKVRYCNYRISKIIN